MASICTYKEWPDLPERGKWHTCIENTSGVWIRVSKDDSELELFHDGKFVASWRKPDQLEIPGQFLAMMDELYALGVRNSLSKRHVLEWLEGHLQ